jgi:arylsulfatase A-like enzyme
VNLAKVNGRDSSGAKASMLEGGSRVPLLANWPGMAPAGRVNEDLIDFSDFFATCAELGGAKTPEKVTLDSHSFATQIKGQTGKPREWVYVELNGKSYARGSRFKLTNKGELFDLAEAPYKELLVATDSTDAAALAARKQLEQVLKEHPAAPGANPDKAAKKAGKKNRKKGKA